MPPSETQSPAGVIHDIGYRGYRGQRLGRRPAMRALYAHSLRGVYGIGRSAKSKVLPFGLFALMCMPAVVIAVVTVVGAGQGLLDQPVADYASYATYLQAAIAIFLATQAPQAVSLDLRFNTLPLYLSRPLERVDYVLAKYAGLSTGVFILLAVPILIMYAGALLGEFSFGEQTLDMLLALVGAALFALVLAGISLVIASLTPRRGLGIAAIITVLFLSYGVVSALQGFIGHAQGDMTAAGWIGLFSPMTLVDGVQVWAFGASSNTAAAPADDMTGIVFCVATLAVIAGCYRLLLFRYRRVRL